MVIELAFVFYMWIIFIIISFIISGILLYNTYKLKFTINKIYLYGFNLTLLIHGIARIFYFIYDFIKPEEEIWWSLGALFGAFCAIPLIVGLESVFFKKSKFLLTIIYIFGIFLILLDIIFWIENHLILIISYVLAMAFFIIAIIVYIVVAKKTLGSIRKTAILMIVGLIILELAQTFHTSIFQEFFWWSYYLSPVLMIIALIIIFIIWEHFFLKES